MVPVRLPKGKVLRTKNAQAAAQIFAAMPDGCARRDGNEVVVMRPVVMSFEAVPEPAAAVTATRRPFLFDFPPR